MRKILILICLMIFANIANATDWIKIGYKLYKETGYQGYSTTYRSAWFKMLNPGDWEQIDGKKVWYDKTLYKANCSNKTLFPSYTVSYGLKEEVLSSDSYPDISSYYKPIISESVGETIYYSLCRY